MFNERRNHMHRKKKFLLIPIFIILLFSLSSVIQRLWNGILPDAVHASTISYWQAMGLLVLCRILFGRFHFGGRGDRPGGFGGAGQGMREKWMKMSDEERATFKQRFKDRCRNRR